MIGFSLALGAGSWSNAFAQTASLRATVTDTTGGVVAGAEASLTGSGPGSLSRTSGNDGTVVFEDIAPGVYVLRLEAPGFAVSVQDVSVQSTGSTVEVRLEVAGPNESVAVVGSKVAALAVSLHFGNFGGLPVKVLWAVLA
jgi:hypothetical protein